MNTFTQPYVSAFNVVIGAAAVAGPVISLPNTDIPVCFGIFFNIVTLNNPADVITIKAQVNDGSVGAPWLDVPSGTLSVAATQFASLSVPGKSPKVRLTFSAAGPNAGQHDTISINISGLPTGTVIA